GSPDGGGVHEVIERFQVVAGLQSENPFGHQIPNGPVPRAADAPRARRRRNGRAPSGGSARDSLLCRTAHWHHLLAVMLQQSRPGGYEANASGAGGEFPRKPRNRKGLKSAVAAEAHGSRPRRRSTNHEDGNRRPAQGLLHGA